ncbi:hypothetical protein K3495_g2963 [Podosphaera aphanis]|nr:hypothetical protein K3495_g2963 [Podosphaera aphanis]
MNGRICAQRVRNRLITLIQDTKPTYDEIESLIHELRIACEQTIFLDFEFAAKECVGRHLWDAHTLINNRYRKSLGRYKIEKKLNVERRKIVKHYVDFIKTSQFFYKGYIQRLASHFSGIKGLLRVARSLHLSQLSADPPTVVSSEVQKLIEQSCYASLLRLGDLSRYRNMLRTRQQSWQPAMGYYQLANDLYPMSGMAHNKMAVIALAEANHLNAVYHLYRAISAPEPDPLAPGNLAIEFKKILSARFTARNDPAATLSHWFVLLHANFNEGIDFPTHEELQNEVLSRLTLLLKEESCGGLLEKFVLVNIAAQAYSCQQLQDQGPNKSPEAVRTFAYHVSFNVRMMFQLLSVLLPELEDQASDGDQQHMHGINLSASYVKISDVAHRVLPALRHYTLWLASNKSHIRPDDHSSKSQMHNKQLWNMYAIVLTRLVNYFNVQDMATVPYLLQEDVATVGFAPLRDPILVKAHNLYTKSDSKLKPYIEELGIKRSHPDIEMQSRILDIVCCGIQLQIEEDVPLKLDHDSGYPVFTFVEDDVPPLEYPMEAHQSCSPDHTRKGSTDEFTAAELYDEAQDTAPDVSVTASDSYESLEISMSRMVDNLVEPSSNLHVPASCETSYGIHSSSANEVFATSSIKVPGYRLQSTPSETSYGMHSSTANEIFASPLVNIPDYRLQSTPKMFPSLPSLFSSAFTPQPNELTPISPNQASTARRFSHL